MCTYVGIIHPALPKNINNHHADVLSLQMLGLTLASSFVLSSSEASSYMGQGENNTPGAVVKRKRKNGSANFIQGNGLEGTGNSEKDHIRLYPKTILYQRFSFPETLFWKNHFLRSK
jgi:hypothetical protein